METETQDQSEETPVHFGVQKEYKCECRLSVGFGWGPPTTPCEICGTPLADTGFFVSRPV